MTLARRRPTGSASLRDDTATKPGCHVASSAASRSRPLPTGRPSKMRGRGARLAPRTSRPRRYRLFHRVMELLHERLPARLPIDARLGRVRKGLWGYCRCEPSQFRIRVSDRLAEEFAIGVLEHEWAHALASTATTNVLEYLALSAAERERWSHGPAWGRAYAKVYATVMADILPQIRREQCAARRRSQARVNK